MDNRNKHLDWWRPVFGENEKVLLAQVIESGFPNDGPLTTEFENQVAALIGVPYAIAVTSCTAGLYLSLMALGIGAGDEVLVPDITFIATANAVTMTGATPVLVDVDPKTFCIDITSASNRITSRTKAIIPVHVSGRGADMQAISSLAQKHSLYVIEDAAEAFGSCQNKKPLGSFGATGCFSFSPAKTITTGQGGMITTSDENLHGRLRELKDQGRPKRGTGGDDTHISVGFNFKFTDLQAAVGLAQLQTIEERKIKLQRQFEIYSKNILANEFLRFPGFDLKGGEFPQWTDVYAQDRNGLDSFLESQNAHCRRFWHPLHTQAPYRRSSSDFPGSTAVSNHGLWLPSSLDLTEDDLLHICDLVNEWAQKHARTQEKVMS